jgi:uncharacterized protein with PIN domain
MTITKQEEKREVYRPKQFCPKCRVEMVMTHWPASHAQTGDWMGYFRVHVCPECGTEVFEGKEE